MGTDGTHPTVKGGLHRALLLQYRHDRHQHEHPVDAAVVVHTAVWIYAYERAVCGCIPASQAFARPPNVGGLAAAH